MAAYRDGDMPCGVRGEFFRVLCRGRRHALVDSCVVKVMMVCPLCRTVWSVLLRVHVWYWCRMLR
jgi:hypothetical protein